MDDKPCPFCAPDAARVFHRGDLVLGLWDGFPVSPGHALLVTRRHVVDWFGATIDERRALTDAVEIAHAAIASTHAPAGFNLGVNVGAAGGQTVPHLHLHVIPRYAGDVENPRGGVRHVIPGRGFYSDDQSDEVTRQPAQDQSLRTDLPTALPIAAAPPWISQARANDGGELRERAAHYGLERDRRLLPGQGEPLLMDSTAFGERMLQLLGEAKVSTSYKYAVLLAMLDLSVEIGSDAQDAISTARLAERVLELYWPQTADYAGLSGAVSLRQSGRGQAEIVAEIRAFRARTGSDPSEPLHSARRRDPSAFARLLRSIEWKLVEMPLPRLQRLGDSSLDFLYRIGWGEDVTRSQLEAPGFDRHVRLHAGVREHLVRSAGLLRPLIQQAWTNLIVRMNREATDDARLQEFLFGACRISLDPIRQDLRELQNNRCFYCDHRIDGIAEIDHFIPWARHPDNGIENLVATDAACNNNKRDFLAAGEHLERWTSRFVAESSSATQLVDIAARAGWERHPTRTLAAARTIYSRLPADVRLWQGRNAFVPVATQRESICASLALRSKA